MFRNLAKLPLIGRLLLILYRIRVGLSFVLGVVGRYVKWLFVSKETTNLTYHLRDDNLIYLGHFIAAVTGKTYQEITLYFNEILEDKAFYTHVEELYRHGADAFKSDKEVRLARRIGWYAIIRVAKPKVVIETGVDKGLGSCVIGAALLRNKEEGFEGTYYGTDINPSAGFLFKPPYSQMGKILYGDSIKSLKEIKAPIDVFINDSDHSENYEAEEYETIKNQLSASSYIIADNAHCNTKLHEFALKTNRKFLYFQEVPKNHWYLGASIAVAFEQTKPLIKPL
ncbi:class I SAM-dependent methyltransferase [Runella aurantiaca]|uniref:Class I SAM-dependent methyltransferase n=1 Tax=Runella aurantiaca TaxID=2282308 RepID=A0A369IDV6_9BACT|nr:class I SAM-dependent methyltransferase [Runella aurantiaca]RDB04826.1 class I SAM-dependent methyltransferase [Runella aurantiaca]